ncbi:MAG: hypothetical protein V4628_17925 [Pseudomonadota bacterium]
MTHRKPFHFVVARTLALLVTLATGVLANAQGTASQPALDDGRPATDAQTEAQKPADAVAIHEGAGPIDCETLLAQENNTQPGPGRANDTSRANGEPASGPYRENQPNEDTQISTVEECRAQQNADPDHQPKSTDKE